MYHILTSFASRAGQVFINYPAIKQISHEIYKRRMAASRGQFREHLLPFPQRGALLKNQRTPRRFPHSTDIRSCALQSTVKTLTGFYPETMPFLHTAAIKRISYKYITSHNVRYVKFCIARAGDVFTFINLIIKVLCVCKQHLVNNLIIYFQLLKTKYARSTGSRPPSNKKQQYC